MMEEQMTTGQIEHLMKELETKSPLHAMMLKFHEEEVAKGFRDTSRSFGEDIALIHSELSEALEEHRSGNPDFYLGNADKPEGIAIELVDAAIRIFALLGHMKITETTGMTLDDLFKAKYEYNKTRPYKHGRNY